MKKSIPMAICYDFDGTLAPGNMQEHNFLPALGIEASLFWDRTKELAKEEDSDEILAYMKLMLDLAHEARLPVRRSDFRDLGAKLEFFPGVRSWFPRINAYAAEDSVPFQDQQRDAGGIRQFPHQRLRAQRGQACPLREHRLYRGRRHRHTLLPPIEAGRRILHRGLP